MRKLLILSLIFTFIPVNSFSQDKIDEMRKEIAVIQEKLSSVNQRIDDLDKKLSQRIDDLDKKLDQRIDGINNRIDDVNNRIGDLKDIIFGGFAIIIGGLGILATGMVALVGFVLWDRRTALAPAIKEIKEVKDKEKIVEETLKIYAQKNIEFKKAMETTGLIPARA